MGAKIKREIKLLRYFNHPNIIRLYLLNMARQKVIFLKSYEVLETQTDIYVIMELIEKGELFEMVSKRGRVILEGMLSFI